MQTVNYSKSSAYKILTKKEKRFLNEWIDKLKEEFRSRELEQEFFVNIEPMKFQHRDQILQLFFESDEFGSVPETLNPIIPKVKDLENLAKRTIDQDVKHKLMGIKKDVYGRGAYKRWKKFGLLSENNTIVTMNGQKFQIVREGKKFRLVVPGQTQLQLSNKGVKNAKRKEK